MNRPRAPVLLMTLLALAAPLAASQGAAQVDVAVASVTFWPDPTVDVDGTVTALVKNPSAIDVVTRVDFAYADGTPINPPQTGQESSMTRNVPANGELEFNLSWTPAFARRSQQAIVATISAVGDRDPTNNTLRAETFVRDPRLNLTFEVPPTVEVLPSSFTFVRFFVRNDGNVNDTPMPILETNAPWKTRMLGVMPEVLPGKSATGHILVQAPTVPARNLSLDMQVASSVRAAVTANATAPGLNVTNVSFEKAHAVRIENLSSRVQAFDEFNTTLEVLVRNVGQARGIWNVTAVALGEGWKANASWLREARPNESFITNGSLLLPLDPGEARAVRVNVSRTPAAALEAQLVVNASSESAFLLGGHPRHEAANATARATLLRAAPDLAIGKLHPLSAIYRDDGVVLTVDVHNNGRLNATNVTLDMEIRDNLRAIEATTLALPNMTPNSTRTVRWDIPAIEWDGDFVLTATVRANGTPADPVLADNARSWPLHVRGPSIHVHAPEVLEVAPGSRLLLASSSGGFSVENRGQDAERVVVELNGTEAWAAARWTVDVPPGARMALELNLPIPAYPLVSRVEADVSAWVEARPRFRDQATTTFELTDVEPPEIALEAPAANGRVGVSATFVARVRDATGVARAEAVVAQPDESRVLVTLVPNATDPTRYEGSWKPLVPGLHRITLRAADLTPHGHAASLENVSWTVDAPEFRGLVPDNFEDGGRISRATLRFREADPGTTRAVQADVGDGWRPLAFPYELDVSFWQEGDHQVRLRAESRHGATWEATYKVVLDVTPPNLTEAVQRLQPDGRLELSVVSDEASQVRVRFQTDGGPVEVPLSRQGGGRFGAVVAPPESWSSLVLIGSDPAGNEASLVVESRDARTPAPGVLPALAVLALAALAARRRR